MRLTEIEEMPSLGQRSAAPGGRIDSAGGNGRRDAGPPVASTGRSYDGIGAMLREARERAGLDARDVARQLRIRHAYLEAIEQGRFRDLPGLTYAIGYVRSYAEFLGLDRTRSVALFKEESSDLAEPTTLSFPSPAPEGKVPGGALVFVSALLAVTIYAGWYYATSENRSLAEMIPELPNRIAALVAESTVPDAAPLPTGGTIETAPMGSQADLREARAETPETVEAEPPEAGRDAMPADRPVIDRQVAIAPPATDISRPIGPTPAPRSAAPVAATGPTERPAIQSAAATDGATAAPPVTAPDRVPDSAAAGADRPTATGVSVAPDVPAKPVAETPSTRQPPQASSPGGGGDALGTGPSKRYRLNSAEASLVPLAPAPAVVASGDRPAAGEASPGAAPGGAGTLTPAGGTAPVDDARPRTVVASAVAIPAAPPVDNRSTGVAGRTEILIRATGDSWVQIRGADSAPLMTRIMRDGDVYRVPERDGLVLLTGNAGALEITVDGAPIARLGGYGEVVRNVALDRSLLTRTPR